MGNAGGGQANGNFVQKLCSERFEDLKRQNIVYVGIFQKIYKGEELFYTLWNFLSLTRFESSLSHLGFEGLIKVKSCNLSHAIVEFCV